MREGERCCTNDKTAACCGPKQTCNAQNVTQATCKCAKGTKCGPDCCIKDKGEKCCKGERCCTKGETCIKAGCCPRDQVCSDACCGENELCLWKATLEPDGNILYPLGGTCKRGCAPANRAGTQCCGTGYKPNRKKTGCVKT